MKHVLPLLIERAQAVRDRQAQLLRQAQQSAAQAQSTLQRLDAFRGECLSRSAAAQLGHTDGNSLAGYQQFVGRLDEAIGMQGQEATLREAQAATQLDRSGSVPAARRRRASATNARSAAPASETMP